jgi:hypothetical protein
VYEKVVIGEMSFALIAIVPLNGAVGVYVSDAAFASGPVVSVEVAVAADVVGWAVPIATVTVPRPVFPVMPVTSW